MKIRKPLIFEGVLLDVNTAFETTSQICSYARHYLYVIAEPGIIN
jgi:hypothetical protein